MRKSVLLLATLMFLVTFTSCFKDKETEYKPKEKISRIYTDFGYGKYLDEVWNWDGKLVKSIDHYDEGNLDWVEEFTYNKKDQIERIDCYATGESMEYSYDGSKLQKITYYYNGTLVREYAFKHDGKKITEIEIMSFINYKRGESHLMNDGHNPIKTLLPEKSYKELDKILSKTAAAKGGSVSVKLEWDKNNVSKIDLTEGAYRATCNMTYDDKLNPFTNFFSLNPAEYYYTDCMHASKNNVTEVRTTMSEDGETETEVDKYSYSYDGKYPEVKRYTYTYEYYDDWEEEFVTETYTISTFYEYE